MVKENRMNNYRFLVDSSVILSSFYKNEKNPSFVFLQKHLENVIFSTLTVFETLYLIEDKNREIKDKKILNEIRNIFSHHVKIVDIENQKGLKNFFENKNKFYKKLDYDDFLNLFFSKTYNKTLVTLDKDLIDFGRKEKISVMTPSEVLSHEKSLH